MVTGFDIWGHDRGLRRHWKFRILAFVFDSVIIFISTAIVLYFLEITEIVQIGIVSSIVFYLFSAITESLAGGTPGKLLFRMRVHGTKEGGLAARIFLRNLSRLFWFILPPLDFALGLATRGDPRQRLLDRAAGTTVVHREEKKRHKKHITALAQKDNVEEVPERESPMEDTCQECGGPLMTLADQKLQCESCGLIQ